MSSHVSPASLEAPVKDSQILESLFRERRATASFRPDPVPAQVIDKALHFASEAPSGFNFQPWRFLILRTQRQRDRLREAANGQTKISQAPLVIVAFADHRAWREAVDEIFASRAARTGAEAPDLAAAKANAFAFVDQLPPEVWLTRQVMIAFTYLMLAFESLGWNTAPMEGFDAGKVRSALELPSSTEVVALLAVGRDAESATLHPGRLPVQRIAFDETLEKPWPGLKRSEGNPAYPPEITPA